jgi:hypothetical protein
MSMTPTRKVTTGFLVGQVAAVSAWAVKEFWRIEIPPEIALSIGGILIAAIQFMVTDR